MDEQQISSTAAPWEWADALDRAGADVAAGRTETWQAVRQRVTAKIEAMEARRTARPA